jgi:anti-anti-sigma regulatory factor
MDVHNRQLAPEGDLTIFEAAEFKAALCQLFANEGLVCLDLTQAKRIDTAGIQLMWGARKSGRLLVTGIPQELQSKLTQLGFAEPLSE